MRVSVLSELSRSRDFKSVAQGGGEVTEDEAKEKLPDGYTIEIQHFTGFYRCTIRGYLGQPKGIGEAAGPSEAIEKALDSLKKDLDPLR